MSKARRLSFPKSQGKVSRIDPNQFPLGKRFNFMFAEGWFVISELGLTATEYSVFSRLMGHMGFENWVPISQETLGEELGIKKPHVSTALKRLTELKVVERQRDPIDKRRWMYRINPYLGWKGNPKDWNDRDRAGKVIPLYPGVKPS